MIMAARSHSNNIQLALLEAHTCLWLTILTLMSFLNSLTGIVTISRIWWASL
jgi:hypothetical protein